MDKVIEGAKGYREKLTKNLGLKEEANVIAMAHLMVAVQTSNVLAELHKLVFETAKQYFQMREIARKAGIIRP